MNIYTYLIEGMIRGIPTDKLLRYKLSTFGSLSHGRITTDILKLPLVWEFGNNWPTFISLWANGQYILHKEKSVKKTPLTPHKPHKTT